jgi:hypothetical protein
MHNQKTAKAAAKPDWNSGVRLQLLHFRSLPIKEKIQIVEDMEFLTRFMLEKKKQRARRFAHA